MQKNSYTALRVNNYFPFLICGIASLFLLYEFVLQISPSTMIPEWMSYFKADAMRLGLACAFFYYAYAPAQLIGGYLYDRVGARLTLCIATTICATGALCVALAHTLMLVAVGRFLMGTGAAFAFVGVLFVGSQWLPARYFASVASFTELMSCIGAVMATAPLALAVKYCGWKPVIFFLALAGYGLAFLYKRTLRDREQVQVTKTYSLSSVFKSSQLWVIGVYSFLVFAPMSIFAALWGVPFLQAKLNISTVLASQACSMIWIGMAVGSILIGIFSDMFSVRKVALMTSSILGIFVSTILIYYPFSLDSIYFILFLFGASTSGQILSFAVVKDNVGSNNVGLSLGFNNMLTTSGGALLQPFVGFLLHMTWHGKMINNVPVYTLNQYKAALIIIPICYICSALICRYFIRETYCKPVTQSQNYIKRTSLENVVES